MKIPWQLNNVCVSTDEDMASIFKTSLPPVVQAAVGSKAVIS